MTRMLTVVTVDRRLLLHPFGAPAPQASQELPQEIAGWPERGDPQWKAT
jgi:hypothetical protein